jgi:S1-C subfamily serine protease
MHELELGGTLAGGKVSESQWDSMVEKTSASAFKVVVSDCAGQPIATGSGFDIGQYVVTNRHVVEDAGRI